MIPLEDLIEEYAPNFKKLMEEDPTIRSSITTPDGHIYALPGLDHNPTSKTPIMWLNGRWLEALGMDKPSTMDEFYELLKAFKEKDPSGVGDVIPLTANSADDLPDWPPAQLRPSVHDNGIYVDDDGVVRYAFIQPQFKESTSSSCTNSMKNSSWTTRCSLTLGSSSLPRASEWVSSPLGRSSRSDLRTRQRR